ncbi:entericidin A/B family lipoprotein [Niveibacterium sp. SC-1]
MMKIVRIVLVALAALSLTACNTVHGFGKDVEKVGDKIQGKK